MEKCVTLFLGLLCRFGLGDSKFVWRSPLFYYKMGKESGEITDLMMQKRWGASER